MRGSVFIAAGCLGLLVSCASADGGEPEQSMSVGRVYSALTSESGIAREVATAYGPHARHRLDIYRAKRSDEKAPIAIFFYGGGWTAGDRATYTFVGAALAARGITTVIPDYRLYPETKFPGFMDDAAMAYAWVARNLAKACRETRPIILIGHSAGGYIAALLTLDRSYLDRHAAGAPAPSALIGLAGPYAFDPTTWPSTKEIFVSAAGRPDSARPVAFVRGKAPPALLMHGLDDDTVRLFNTRDLAAALTKNGNTARAIEYEGIGHIGLVLAISRPLRWRAPVLDDMMSFIDAQAGGQKLARNCEKAGGAIGR